MSTQSLQATAVVRKNSIDFVKQVFALYEARRPLVTVTDEAQAHHLLGIEIDRCIVPAEDSGWFRAPHPLIHDDTPAQVTFTSGTEGRPKGILLSYANLADATERIVEQMQMTSDIREYVGVPATFSFGMARYRAVAAVGGQAYLSPRGFDPLELARMLAAGEVNALSVVPTLLRILLASPEVIGEAGKQLRWMEIGSQHMTVKEKLLVRELFPNALIVQHYGLTEASRSTFLRVSEVSPQVIGSVGRPVGQTEVQLNPEGRIQIRGPHVAKSRIDGDGLHDLRDADGWLQTNDLGHWQDGYLFFDGRADDLINCGGMKIVPDQMEERMRSSLGPGVQIAVAKVPDAQRGEGVLVAAQVDSPGIGRVNEAAVAALRAMGIEAGSSLHVMAVDQIPVTGTGKVQRGLLAERFLAQNPVDCEESKSRTDTISDVLALFRREFPGQAVQPADTFESLGGDSLHYIQFSLSFEQRFGPLPNDWEKLTVAELQGNVGEKTRSPWRRLESITLARAFFIVCIVALHTDAFVYSPNWGAAYFLVLLAGYSVVRFQLPEILRTSSVRTLLGTARYVAVPSILLIALLEVLTQRFEIMPLLLISNYLDPSTLKGFLFYFIEIYVQLLLLVALMFSSSKVRESFRARPFLSALVLLLMVVVIRQTIEGHWDTDYNYRRTPWNYAWAFALGMLIASADELRTKVLALGISLALVTYFWGLTSASLYVGGACALVLFVRTVMVPAPAKVVIAEIGGASLFIFLSHELVISVVIKLFGENMPWSELLLALFAGVAIAHAYAWAVRRFVWLAN